MKPKELHDEWSSGETGMRPSRVQEVRDDLEDAIGIPVPRRLSEIENWLDTMQSQVTAKLGNSVKTDEEEDNDNS